MCAYPKVNGAFACENGFLNDVLRREWGFGGYVLADYGAAHSGAVAAQRPGLRPVGELAHAYEPPQVRAALEGGAATMADVDEHVRAILRTHFAFGVFDREPYYEDARIDRAAHLDAARRIEEGGITLLRNRRRTLPLEAGRLETLAVIGRPAKQFTTGGGSANVVPFDYVPALKAIAGASPAGSTSATPTAATAGAPRGWPGAATPRSSSPPTTRRSSSTGAASACSARAGTATRTR